MLFFWLLILSGAVNSFSNDSVNVLSSSTTSPSGKSFPHTSSKSVFETVIVRQAVDAASCVAPDGPSSAAASFFPCASSEQGNGNTKKSASPTVISNTNGILTLSTGITTPITTSFANGVTTTIHPSNLGNTGTGGTSQTGTTFVNSASQTVISNSNGKVTLPRGVTTAIKTTFPNGKTTIITPSDLIKPSKTTATEDAVTLVDSASETVIANTNGIITLPTGLTGQRFTTVLPNGHSTTITLADITPQTTLKATTRLKATTTSSGSLAGFLIPVTTSVASPKPTHGGAVIPCDLWFFSICLRWDDFKILGWVIELPQGVYPPGPPPPLSINPSASVSIHISGVLPDWPKFTIGPDGVPKFPPKPLNGPDNGCKTETAELCATKTSYGVSTSDQKTITTTTRVLSTCATVLGCNVENTATTATTTGSCTTVAGTASGPGCSATSSTYVVYPKDGTDKSQVDSISAQLRKYVDDPSTIQPSNTKTFGLNFWLLPLNQSSAEKVQAIPDVVSAYPQCNSSCWKAPSCPDGCYDASTTAVYQSNAPEQLAYVPWPRFFVSGIWWDPQRPLRYYFDDSAGQHIPVYVLDTGATMSHPEFDLIRDRVRWMHVGAGPQPNNDATNINYAYHGTSVLSTIAGKTLSVAKYIDPIIVRLQQGFTPEAWLTGLSMINDDLGTQAQAEAKAIVSLAEYFPPSALGNNPQGWVDRCHAIMTEMASKGAVLVTGSGNELTQRGGQVNGWPANFGKTTVPNTIQSLIVVGALTAKGDGTVFADDPASGVPHIYAPGVYIQVANGAYPLSPVARPSKIARGTSLAQGMTVGLAANFLRLIQLGQLRHEDGTAVTNSPQSIKDYILSIGYSREPVNGRNRKGIYNGAALAGQSCPWTPNNPSRFRREENDGKCVPPLSAPAKTTTTTKPPAPTQTTPLERKHVVCEDAYSGHGDIIGDTVTYLGTEACNQWTSSSQSGHISSTSEGFNITELSSYQVHYTYSLHWIDGCITTVSAMSIESPLGGDGPTCPEIFRQDFENCNNGGVGGYIDVGCLRYRFFGGQKS